MVNDVTFGQYFPGKSLIHRTDPRVKIVLLIGFIVLMFCTFNFVSLGVVTLATFAIILLSRVPLKMYLSFSCPFSRPPLCLCAYYIIQCVHLSLP